MCVVANGEYACVVISNGGNDVLLRLTTVFVCGCQ